jgi:hypothetical protein
MFTVTKRLHNKKTFFIVLYRLFLKIVTLEFIGSPPAREGWVSIISPQPNPHRAYYSTLRSFTACTGGGVLWQMCVPPSSVLL